MEVARTRAEMDTKEQRLSSHPGDLGMTADPFTNNFGHFWEFLATREHMCLRRALVSSLQAILTRDSVQAQLGHVLDMLRLCRSDTLGVRNLAPALMLRLDKDQEAYNFVKFWSLCGRDGDYDWYNASLPFLNLQNESAFEDPDYILPGLSSLSHNVAFMFLKIKLMLDLVAIQRFNLVAVKLPPELLNIVKTHIAQSPIIANDTKILSCTHKDLG